MTWTAFWNGIAAFFEFCFKILKALGNNTNAVVWVIIIVLLAYWTLQLRKHGKEAREKGTLI